MKVIKTFIQDTKTGVKKIADTSFDVKEDANFEFSQGIPQQAWTINHGLNKYPSVTIVDSGGNEYEADVNHTDKNSLTILFSVPFSGTAILN